MGGREAIFVQLCYCVKQNTAKPSKRERAGVLAGASTGLSGTAVLH